MVVVVFFFFTASSSSLSAGCRKVTVVVVSADSVQKPLFLDQYIQYTQKRAPTFTTFSASDTQPLYTVSVYSILNWILSHSSYVPSVNKQAQATKAYNVTTRSLVCVFFSFTKKEETSLLCMGLLISVYPLWSVYSQEEITRNCIFCCYNRVNCCRCCH